MIGRSFRIRGSCFAPRRGPRVRRGSGRVNAPGRRRGEASASAGRCSALGRGCGPCRRRRARRPGRPQAERAHDGEHGDAEHQQEDVAERGAEGAPGRSRASPGRAFSWVSGRRAAATSMPAVPAQASCETEAERGAEDADAERPAHGPEEDDRAGRRAAAAPTARRSARRGCSSGRSAPCPARSRASRRERTTGRTRPGTRRPIARLERTRGDQQRADRPPSAGTRAGRPPSPATATLIDQARNSGVIVRPATVAEPPVTPCTNSGTYVSMPNSRPPIRKLPAIAAAMCGVRSRSSGRTGSAARRSRQTNRREQDDAPAPAGRPPGQGASPPRRTASSSDRRPRREQRRARPVDRQDLTLRSHRLADLRDQDPRRDHRERDGHEEDPAPRELVGQHAAQRRPGQARHAPDGAEEPLNLRPLLQREQVAEHRQHDRPDGPRAEALDHPHRDQLRHALRRARKEPIPARTAPGRTAARACARAGRRACRRSGS